MSRSSPTLIGAVGGVAGSRVSVRLAESLASGIALIGGRSYRAGQVGSFVRIPQGYHDLYAIVSEVGASAAPQPIETLSDRGERWMTIQLVGEIVEATFERGIGQYPNINDEVHLVTEADLAKIYGSAERGHVVIGRLANAEAIPARIDLDKLVTRHGAVLGSTGSGKSTAVASLLRATAGSGDSMFPSARVLLLDIHGEYAKALSDIAKVYRINPGDGEERLEIPYWALPPLDLLNFLMGRFDDRVATAVLERIFEMKLARAKAMPIVGLDLDSMTVDSPVPYNIRQLWLDLIDPEVKTWRDKERTNDPALIEKGDAEALRAPRYDPATTTNTAPYQNNAGVLGIRRQLDHMRARLLDKRFRFLLTPGPFTPNLEGRTDADLAELLKAWLGHDKPITVLDLSGVPSTVLVQLIGAILSLIYEALFWGRHLKEGGRSRPQLVVMEEAHRYLGKDAANPARDVVQRIVKEGRKFGIGAMIISQRPSEIDDTILSQCGTFFAMRLSNSADRHRVQGALPDSLSGVTEALPVLRTGEAIVTGEAAKLPMRCRISLPPKSERPDSGDPEVAEGWRATRKAENYAPMAAAWRAQDARFKGD